VAPGLNSGSVQRKKERYLMSKIDVARAWKDESYRLSLGEAERALLPENPAGPVELSDADLTGAGGANTGGTGVMEFTYSGSFCLCNTKSICTYCEWC
jgi:mersacidin/lichenicidin family type 2 lantibiotic